MSWLLNLLYWGALGTKGTECYMAGDRDAHAVPFQAASALSSVPRNTPRDLTSFGSDSAAVRRRTGARLGQAGPRKHLAHSRYKRLPPWSWRGHSTCCWIAWSTASPGSWRAAGAVITSGGTKAGRTGTAPLKPPSWRAAEPKPEPSEALDPRTGLPACSLRLFNRRQSLTSDHLRLDPGKGKEQKCQ